MADARAALCLTALLGFLFVSCSSPGRSEQEPDASDGVPAEVAKLYPDYGAAVTDWQQVPDFQRRLIEDGELTYAEYEAAVLAFASCVEESGLRFEEMPKYNAGSRRFDFAIITGSTRTEAMAGDSKIMACGAEYLSSVQAVWNWINRPTQEEFEKADGVWRDCLTDGGEEAAEIANIPPWGSDAFDKWLTDHLVEEAKNPSADFPTWRRCLDVVRSQFPTG